MSYDDAAKADTASGHTHDRHAGWGHRDGYSDTMGWAKRPGFNLMKALAVVAAFAIFPPLGLGALAWFVWNERNARHSGPGFRAYDGEGRQMCGRGRHGQRGWRTGNAAFDEHSANVMNDLAQDRRAFFDYRAAERRKRDQEAFDAFKASKADKAGNADSGNAD